jgi:hypothetical protein
MASSDPEMKAAGNPSLYVGLFNKFLGFLGVPSLGDGQNSEKVSTDWESRRFRTEAGRRLLRNPDGSYGRKSSSLINPQTGNLPENLLRQAASAGSEVLNTWAEGFLKGYGRAKVNVTPSLDGYVTGSIDFLSPIYDSQRTTVFSQFGLRTMPGERIFGNMGVGQRLFWGENLAVGYNLFLDQDFTRGHVRGGAGLEFRYDWLRLSGNYYRPLSGWKESKDFDHRYVEERPAEGWDARLTDYLPFYRHLAVNMAFEEWFGELVGAFGQADRLYSRPKVWNMGLTWTPVPLISISVDTRSSHGQTETQLSMAFNLMSQVKMPETVYRAIMEHHERLDGQGYPNKMSGQSLSLAGRILKIADVYDALVSKRQYKEAMPVEKAYRIMKEGVGAEFDEALMSVLEEEPFNGAGTVSR